MMQENFFSKKIATKSDSELQNYIDNKTHFQEDAVLAAIWELEKRNKAGENSKKVKLEIEQERKDSIEKIEKQDPNITDDINAPILYHSRFILIFGAILSVFASSILMALNFAQIDKKKMAWLVVFSGLLYSVLQITILNLININLSGLTIAMNFLGMYILESVFWKKYVPSDLKYRKRNIWGPIIIGVIIQVPIIYLILFQ